MCVCVCMYLWAFMCKCSHWLHVWVYVFSCRVFRRNLDYKRIKKNAKHSNMPSICSMCACVFVISLLLCYHTIINQFNFKLDDYVQWCGKYDASRTRRKKNINTLISRLLVAMKATQRQLHCNSTHHCYARWTVETWKLRELCMLHVRTECNEETFNLCYV